MKFHICIKAPLPKAADPHICKRCRHSILNQRHKAQSIVMHDVLGDLALQSHFYQASRAEVMWLRNDDTLAITEKGTFEAVMTAGRKRKVFSVDSRVELTYERAKEKWTSI